MTLLSTISLYIAFFYILGLIGYEVLIKGMPLANNTTLALGTFSAMSTAITVIFSVWHTKKKDGVETNGKEENNNITE